MTFTDNFTLLACYGEIENAEVGLRCRKCERVFSAEINENRPKNCTIERGVRLTITCPKCKSEADIDGKEAKIFILENYKEKLGTELDKIFVNAKDMPFHVRRPTQDYITLDLSCTKCGKDFTVNGNTGANMARDADSLTMICPGCKASHRISQETATAVSNGGPLLKKYKDAEDSIAFLKGEDKNAK